jgi:hypothetical protein
VLWKWQNAVTGKRHGNLVVPTPIPTVWSLQLGVNCGHSWSNGTVQRKLAPRVLRQSRAYIRVGSGAGATPSSRRCVWPPSAPLRQIEGLHERRFLIHRSEDETEIRAGQSAGRASTIGRQTRRHYSAKEKIHIVLEGLRGRGEHLRAVPPRGHRGLDAVRLF